MVLDDQVLFRTSLTRFLRAQPGLEIAGECALCAEAVTTLADSDADGAVVDFDSGSEQGNALIAAARDAGCAARILIVSGSSDIRSAAQFLKQGVSGIFLKSQPPELLVRAIRVVAEGQLWVDAGLILGFA